MYKIQKIINQPLLVSDFWTENFKDLIYSRNSSAEIPKVANHVLHPSGVLSLIFSNFEISKLISAPVFDLFEWILFIIVKLIPVITVGSVSFRILGTKIVAIVISFLPLSLFQNFHSASTLAKKFH